MISVRAMGCIPISKDTILKAIHNERRLNPADLLAVFNKQRYNFESNSQLEVLADRSDASCIPISKDTILKAIHNTRYATLSLLFAVFQ